jgi:hypothetical protein
MLLRSHIFQSNKPMNNIKLTSFCLYKYYNETLNKFYILYKNGIVLIYTFKQKYSHTKNKMLKDLLLKYFCFVFVSYKETYQFYIINFLIKKLNYLGIFFTLFNKFIFFIMF